MEEQYDATDALLAFDKWFTSDPFTKNTHPELLTDKVKLQMFQIFVAGWKAKEARE